MSSLLDKFIFTRINFIFTFEFLFNETLQNLLI